MQPHRIPPGRPKGFDSGALCLLLGRGPGGALPRRGSVCPMNDQLKKFEAKVKTEWLDDATCAAWRKWHDKSVHFWRELTRAQLAVAQLAPGQRVLDLASGTGDPALDVAR